MSIYILGFFSGMVLIVFSLKLFAQSLQGLSENLLKWTIHQIHKNQILNICSGFLISLFAQSNLSTYYMAASFTNSGIFSARQFVFFSFGVGLGSCALIWLFPFSWGWYELIFLSLGAISLGSFKNPVVKNIGQSLLGLGLIMLSVRLMQNSFGTFAIMPEGFLSHGLSSQIILLLGFLLAIFVRSEVVMVGLACIFMKLDILNYEQSVLFFLMSPLVNGLYMLLKFKTSLSRLKRGVLTFSLTSVTSFILFYSFMPFFLEVSNQVLFFMGAYTDSLESIKEFSQVSVLILPVFYTIYSLCSLILGTILYFPFERLSLRIIPRAKKKEFQKLGVFGAPSQLSPVLAIEQAYQELKKMSAMVESILQLTYVNLGTHQPEKADVERILKYESVTDSLQKEMNEFLSIVLERPLSYSQGVRVKSLTRMTSELESIADKCKAIFYLQSMLLDSGETASGHVFESIKKYFDEILKYYELLFADIADDETVFSNEYLDKSFKEKSFEMKAHYLKLVKSIDEQEGSSKLSRSLGEMLFNIDLIANHTVNIYEAYKEFDQI